MNKIEFINDAYTEDNMRLPMVHFSSDEKDICVIFIHGMCQTMCQWGRSFLTLERGLNYFDNFFLFFR